ncbi:FBD-associated F-box protein At1g61320 [Linum perenne]
MSISMDDILALVARMDWLAYTIYKLNSSSLTQSTTSLSTLTCTWLYFYPTTIDVKSLQTKTSTMFYWPMMRSVYLFGAPCVDQQSKSGTSTKPYMLDSLWLMDFIQMHWSIVNQIQIWLEFHLWHCFNKGKKLDFDLSFQRGLANRDLYMDVVGRIMEQHDGPRIRSLRLSFAPANDVANQALVNRWITKAAQKGVEELDILFNNGSQPFRVTFDLLQIETLEILRLMFVDLGSPTENLHVTGLRFLRVCSMKRMSIDLFLLDVLSNQCLELETLEIINCSTPPSMRFSAGKLKKFRLANCRNLREINLEAPSLISIHYTGHILAFDFKNCAKLIDFMIDLKPTRWVVFEVNRYHILLDKLMSSLSKIEVMTTTSRLLERLCTKFVESGMINHLYDLSMVKEIQLTLEGAAPCNMYSINYFLCKFSCVERIFIDVRGWIQDIHPLQHQNQPQMVLNEDEGGEGHPEQQQQDDLAAMLDNQVNQAVAPGYPHLEQLKLTGFRFEPGEMSLLCHFLQKGNNLKTVAIFTASPRHWQPIMPDVDLFNQHHRPWMSSPNVRINIFSHSREKQLYPTPHPKNWYKS